MEPQATPPGYNEDGNVWQKSSRGWLVSTPEDGRDAAEAVTEGFESINRRVGLVSVEAKEDALDLAADEGGLFSGILLTLALLVVAASAAVTVNLIVLLGQERAREAPSPASEWRASCNTIGAPTRRSSG